MANTFAGGGENRIHDRRRHRWHWRFAHSKWLRRLARNDMHLDRGRITHPRHTVIGIARLLGHATAKGDLAHERGRNSPDYPTLDLLFDAGWVDDETAIDGRYHPLHAHLPLIHRHINNVGDVGFTIVNIARHTAPMLGGN